MTRVIMEAFAALSPEQTQAVKDHQKSPGHNGQLRAVLMHRRVPQDILQRRKATAGAYDLHINASAACAIFAVFRASRGRPLHFVVTKKPLPALVVPTVMP